jgi:ADP-ribose pyrophosphatase YjhB (NUDIX family)
MARHVREFDPERFRAAGVAPGWADAEGAVLAHAALGVYLVRVAAMDGERPLYDTVLRAERGGGVFVPVDGAGRVGLLRIWRPQARDREGYLASFPRIDLAKLGRISYEVPRGYGERGEPDERTAAREAEEETGGRVVDSHPLGAVCDNTAFCPHVCAVMWGRVEVAAGARAADPGEGIAEGLSFFTRPELAALQREGKLYDGFTLSALAMLWLRHPELLEVGR